MTDDLIARLEALEGADREVDAEIANLCFERVEEYLHGHPDTHVEWQTEATLNRIGGEHG